MQIAIRVKKFESHYYHSLSDNWLILFTPTHSAPLHHGHGHTLLLQILISLSTSHTHHLPSPTFFFFFPLSVYIKRGIDREMRMKERERLRKKRRKRQECRGHHSRFPNAVIHVSTTAFLFDTILGTTRGTVQSLCNFWTQQVTCFATFGGSLSVTMRIKMENLKFLWTPSVSAFIWKM